LSDFGILPKDVQLAQEKSLQHKFSLILTTTQHNFTILAAQGNKTPPEYDAKNYFSIFLLAFE
jgi:hypothetical protein